MSNGFYYRPAREVAITIMSAVQLQLSYYEKDC